MMAASGIARGIFRGVSGKVWVVVGAGLGAVLLLWGVVRWHEGRLVVARREAAAAQAALDRAAFDAAAAAAAVVQGRLVRELAGRQAVISKGTDDAIVRDFADLGRRYDDLRVRWATVRSGGADADGATAISGPAGGTLDAACAAGGWVDFEIASAAAQAADQAIAKDDAWIEWASAQAAVWPE